MELDFSDLFDQNAPGWDVLPEKDAKISISTIVPLWISEHSITTPKLLRQYITHLVSCCQENSKHTDDYERIIVPYAKKENVQHPLFQEAQRLAFENKRVRVLPFLKTSGRGIAMQKGFLTTLGKYLFFANPELPVDVHFFREAFRHLESGYALIRGNRRDPLSEVVIPVRLLPKIYSRYCLSVIFNFIVRLVFKIDQTDTQSGSLAMSRPFALLAFAHQTSTRFLFDLELSFIAKGFSVREASLPVSYQLERLRGHFRIIFEILRLVVRTPVFLARIRKGYYRPHGFHGELTADDWGMSRAINQGILDLDQRGIVKNVSIMSETEFVKEGLDELKKIPGVKLGLHFNLTYPVGEMNARKPSELFMGWVFGSKEKKQLFRKQAVFALNSQLKALHRLGVQPAYLDGHHHIHILPGFVSLVAEDLKAYGVQRIRVPYHFSLWFSSRWILCLLSVLARKEVLREKFQMSSFYYPSLRDFKDHARFRQRLSLAKSSEVIVHPACGSALEFSAIKDVYRDERFIEYCSLRKLEYGQQVSSKTV